MTLSSRTSNALMWSAGGLLVTRLISVARFVILARLLDPVDFGVLAIAWATIELLLVVTNPGMGTALIQRRHVDERHYNTVWTAGLLRTLAVGLVLFMAASPIAAVFGEPRAAPFLQALAVAPLLSAAASVKMTALRRQLSYRRVTALGVAESVTEAVVSIALVSLLGVWAIVVGVLTANVVRIVVSYVIAPHRPALMLHRESARSLFSFGKFMFLGGVFTIAGEALLRLAVSRTLGVAELGVFYLAMRLVMMPVQAVEGAISTVGMRAHVELGDDAGRRARGLQTSLVVLLALLMPAYTVLVVLADSAVAVLGPQWSTATGPLRVLSLAAVVMTVNIVSGPLLLAVDRPDIVAWLTCLRAVLIIGFGWTFALHWGLVGATAGVLVAEILVAALTLRLTLPLVTRPLPRLSVQLVVILVASAAAAAAAALLDGALSGLPGLTLSGLASLLLGASVLLGLDRWRSAGVLPLLARVLPGAGRRSRGARSSRRRWARRERGVDL